MARSTLTAEQEAESTYTYIRPPMYPKQEAAIFEPKRWCWIEASTKAGKTVGCIVWLAEMAMGGLPGRNYWWVAPVYNQALIAYNRMRRRFPPSMIETNQTSMTIHILPTDTWIWFKSAERPDALYGEDVYAVIVDEASRVREESWYAIRSTLTATEGPARIIGNVKGRHGWFYRMARRAEKGEDPNAAYHKITAYDAVEAGVLKGAEIDDARAQLPEAVFKELYEADASDDEGNPFGWAAIQACAWAGQALSPNPIVCWGVDLARKRDYTVVCGLDRYGQLAAFYRFQKPWNETIKFVREVCSGQPTYVDMTGIGDVVVGLLQSPMVGGTVIADVGGVAADYSPVQVFGGDGEVTSLDGVLADTVGELNREELGRAFADTAIEGFLYNQKSKQSLMEGLAVVLQHGQTGYPEAIEANTDHPLKIELESFEYIATRIGVRYSAPDGENDDCVNAFALAHKCMQDKVALFGTIAMEQHVSSLESVSTWDFGVTAEVKREQRHEAALAGVSNESAGGWDFGVS